jgi:hypothetical protein
MTECNQMFSMSVCLQTVFMADKKFTSRTNSKQKNISKIPSRNLNANSFKKG